MFEYLIKLELAERKKYLENPEQYQAEFANFKKNLEYFELTPQAVHPANYYMALAIKRVAMVDVAAQKEIPMLGSYKHSRLKHIFSLIETELTAKKYEWTSLVLLGNTLPGKKFKHDAIFVGAFFGTSDFTKSEIGMLSLFSKSSLFETEYKANLDEGTINQCLLKSTDDMVQVKIKQDEEKRLKKEKKEKALMAQELILKKEKESQAATEAERAKEASQALALQRKEQERLAELELKKKEEMKRKEEQKEKNIKLVNACRQPEFEMPLSELRQLIKEGAEINYQSKEDGTTPILAALEHHNEKTAEYLLNHGADPRLHNIHGESAFDLISHSSPLYELMKQKVEEIELSKLPVKAKYSILLQKHVCSFQVRAKQIDEYLQLGADVDYANDDGFTALMLAVDAENERITEYLLKKCGADPLRKNKLGRLASDYAASGSSVYLILKGYELLHSTSDFDFNNVKVILRQSIELIDFKGQNGYTALLIAVEQGLYDIVEYLLINGADLNATCDDGRNVFLLVNDEAIRVLLQKFKEASDDVSIAGEPIEEKIHQPEEKIPGLFSAQ